VEVCRKVGTFLNFCNSLITGLLRMIMEVWSSRGLTVLWKLSCISLTCVQDVLEVCLVGWIQVIR
jgi:hypothetical protein